MKEQVKKDQRLHPFSPLSTGVRSSNLRGITTTSQDFATRTFIVKESFSNGTSRTDPPLYQKAAGQATKYDTPAIQSFQKSQ